MIRVEVFAKNGSLIKGIDFKGDNLKIGRSLECDLIVPDFSMALIEAEIVKNEQGSYQIKWGEATTLIKDRHTFKVKNIRIVITNLVYFSMEQAGAQSQLQRDWLRPLLLFLGVIGFYLIAMNIFATKPVSFKEGLEVIIGVGISLACLTLVLGLISRLVNHEFQMAKIFTQLTYLVFAFVVLANTSLEIRWLPLRFFESWDLWVGFVAVMLAPLYWALIKTVGEHLEQKTKIIFALLPVVLFLTLQAVGRFPFQDRYHYSILRPRPAVFSILESQSISVDELNKKIQDELN